MQPLYTFNVIPKLPVELEPLRELAGNLWWTWEPEARRLFRYLDPRLWEETNHNPVRMLQLCRQGRLLNLAEDEAFLSEVKRVMEKFRTYMAKADTYGSTRKNDLIAYFSAEFGFHESVPNYSGGLGILSGDHCKSASDLGLNFVAVTLLYRHGYFKQQINRDGWQESVELNQDFHHLPMKEVQVDGVPLLVGVPILDREVLVRIWEMAVGRITLYLLDTDIPDNRTEDRQITGQLYGGDEEMRVKQEIVLGIGGVHALRALGLKPAVHHMNEGHSAFLSLELIRRGVEEQGLTFRSALQVVAAGNVFTTHTPVPAGNDKFPHELVLKYFRNYPEAVGITEDEFLSYGQQTRNRDENWFWMPILALRTSRFSNGVSRLHGEVSRAMWHDVWAGVPQEEVPIVSITNGIHTKTWLSEEFTALYDRYLAGWEDRLTDQEFWRGVIDIPDDELWEAHLQLKRRLVAFVRNRVRRRLERVGESPGRARQVNQLLNPEILTIGFARRFATYKRGTLLFSDLDRLKRLVLHPERPVQFVFAGKAHPKDEAGKRLIQEVCQWSREEGLEDRIVFVENYDTCIGRRLTQGVDLWLNNPLRPQEASGTSGMKLPPNGGLNLSVLDGWWKEGYNGKNGWAIGPDVPEDAPEGFQNEADTASLFCLLENNIVPLYYAKPDGRFPTAWLQFMRESIRSVTPVFNTQRMVEEYNELLYEPAAAVHARLMATNAAKARALADWKQEMRRIWPQVRIAEARVLNADVRKLLVGEALSVEAAVELGEMKPADVRVQLYVGPMHESDIGKAEIFDLFETGETQGSARLYRGTVPATESGAYGFSIRVIPNNPDLTQSHELRLITWA